MVEREDRDVFGQTGAGVRFEWGAVGAGRIGGESGCLVVVDILSFTTAVTVGVGRGMTIFPYGWGREGVEEFAVSHDAQIAVPRQKVSADHPWTLSPAHLASAPVTPRLVLPSPNGSAIASAASTFVVAASLRNASAASRWLLENGYGTPDQPVAIVAAGERWPDQSLRPALEDALGAGSVAHRLKGAGCLMSPEADAMAALYQSTPDLERAIRFCASGQQLTEAGFGPDIDMAVQQDSQDTVAVLRDGAFSSP